MGMGGGGGGGGGRGGGSWTSFNGTSTVTPPEEVLKMYRSINPRAEAAANTPWENYSDTPDGFVAQLNDTQRGGMQGIMNNIFGAQPSVDQGFGTMGQGIGAYNTAMGMAGQAGSARVANNDIADISNPYYNTATGYTANAANAPGGLDAANGYLGAGSALAGYGGQGTNQVGMSDIQQYMSPYHSNVVAPTMQMLGQQNEQAMQGALGNIVRGGGMGNDRSGVMMANQNQQNTLANAKVLGDLNNANYSQALNTAVGQRSQNQADLQRAIQAGQTLGQMGQTAGGLRQQDLQRQLAAGQQMAGIGTARRGAYETQQQNMTADLARQLSASQAMGTYGQGLGNIGNMQGQLGLANNQNIMNNFGQQIQAGTLQQQTEQAGKDAMYNQWMQQKAYPFMTTQWLADMYGGLGPLYGSTTTQSGTSMSMPINFSDPRLKSGVNASRNNYRDGGSSDNPEVVGKTFDDQPIYRYSLMGGPAQLGLMADEAATRNPDAVYDVNGLLAMDYAKATDQAADLGHEMHANKRGQHAGGGTAEALSTMQKMYAAAKGQQQAGPNGGGFVPQGKGGGKGAPLSPHPINIPKAELIPPDRRPPPDMAGMLGQMKGLAGLGGKGGGLGSLFSGLGGGGSFDTAAATVADAAPAATTAEHSIKGVDDIAHGATKMASSGYGLGGLDDFMRMFAAKGGRIQRGIGGVMPFNESKGKIPFSPNGGSKPFEQGMGNNVIPKSVMNSAASKNPQMLQSAPPDMMKMAGGQGGGGQGGGGGGSQQGQQLMKMGMDQMKGLMGKGQSFANNTAKISDAATQPVQSIASNSSPSIANSPVHAANSVQQSAPASSSFGDLGNAGSQAASAPQGGIGDIGGAGSQAASAPQGGLGDTLGSLGGVDQAAPQAANSIGDAAGKIGDTASQIGNSATSGLTDVASQAGSGLGEIGSSLGEGASHLASSAGEGLSHLASSAGDGLSGLASAASQGLSGLASSAGSGLAGAGASAAGGLSSMASGLASSAAAAAAPAAGAAAGGLGGLLGFLPLLFSDPKLKTGVNGSRNGFAFGGHEEERHYEDTPMPERRVELVPVEEPRREPVGESIQVADASGDWEKFKRQTLKFEGGYTPDDAGKGPSKYGINATANPGVNIRDLTPDGANQIYRHKYWDSIGADQLPDSTRLLAADASVNQGPAQAKRWAAEAGDDAEKLYHLRQAHYQHLIDRNPGKYGQYANAWNGRLNAVAQQAGVKDLSNLHYNGHDARNPGMGPEYLDRSMSATTDGHEQEVGPGAGMGILDVALPLAAAGIQYAANRGYYGSGPAAAMAAASGLGTLGSMTQQGLANDHERQRMELERRKFMIEQETADRARKEYELKERRRQEYEDAIRNRNPSSAPADGYGPTTAPAPAPVPPPVQETPPAPAPVPPPTSVTPDTSVPVTSPAQPKTIGDIQPTAQTESGGGLGNVKPPAEQVVAPVANPPAPPPTAPAPAPVQQNPNTPDPAKFWRSAQDAANPYFYQSQAEKSKFEYETFRQLPDEGSQARAAAAKKSYDENIARARDAAAAKEIPMKDGTTVPNPWLMNSINQNAASTKQAETDVANRNELVPYQPYPDSPKYMIPKSKALELSKKGEDAAYISEQNPVVAKQLEKLVENDAKLTEANSKRRNEALPRVERMQELSNTFETGKWAEQKANLVAGMRSIGIDVPDTATASPAKFQEFVKNSVANVFDQAKLLSQDGGGRILVSEIEGLLRASVNPENSPEANRQLLGRMKALLKWQDHYYKEYTKWRTENPHDVSTMKFEMEFDKDADKKIKEFKERELKSATALGSDNPPNKKNPDALPPVEKREKGYTHKFSNGVTGVWNGSGWDQQ